MTGKEKMIKNMMDAGYSDIKVWLCRKFGVWHSHPDNRPDPCQWCGFRDHIKYHVPGIFHDGRMNWICQTCAESKYGGQAEEEMEEFAYLRSVPNTNGGQS